MNSHFSTRLSRRLPLDCAVYYSNGRWHASGTLRNLSRSGGCVTGTEPVCPGMHLRLFLVPLGYDGAIMVQDALVRWSSGAAFGIELHDLPLDSQVRLARLVSQERPELIASSH